MTNKIMRSKSVNGQLTLSGQRSRCQT